MKSRLVYSLIGAALMAWGGAGVATRTGLTGWAEINLVLLALGIVCIAFAPVAALEQRVRELEARIAGRAAG